MSETHQAFSEGFWFTMGSLNAMSVVLAVGVGIYLVVKFSRLGWKWCEKNIEGF